LNNQAAAISADRGLRLRHVPDAVVEAIASRITGGFFSGAERLVLVGPDHLAVVARDDGMNTRKKFRPG
jgi:hypothetical protein